MYLEVNTCKRGHAQTEDNIYVDRRGYPRCRECQLERNQRRREEEKQTVTDALAQEFGIPIDPNATPQHRAWIGRRLREKAGLPLRQCDREQLCEQIQDMGQTTGATVE